MLLTRKRMGATAAFVLTSAAALAAQAADIHVQPGDDLARAINGASAGDRVLVHAGTHAGGGWIEASGAEGAPITVVAADGPRTAVIEGGDETLRVGNSAHLVFDGLEIRNAGNNVVHIDSGSHHVVLRNVYAHSAGHNGDVVKVNQSHHITVERSEFARPGARDAGVGNPYQECLDFVDVDDSVIRDSFFHDGGSMLLFVKGGSRRNVIERNVFSEQRDGASDPMVGLGGPTDPELLDGEQYEAIDIVFRNNVLLNGVTGGVAVYDAQGAYIANNLFLNNDRVLVEFRAGEGPAAESRDVRIVNNLMVDTRGRMPEAYRRSSHGLRELTTSNNLFWNAGQAIPPCELVDLASAAGHLVADPGIAAPSSASDANAILASVRPGANSPAAGSAIDATAAPFGVTNDILGVAREGALDRGPFRLTNAPAGGSFGGGSVGGGTGTGTGTGGSTGGTSSGGTSVTPGGDGSTSGSTDGTTDDSQGGGCSVGAKGRRSNSALTFAPLAAAAGFWATRRAVRRRNQRRAAR